MSARPVIWSSVAPPPGPPVLCGWLSRIMTQGSAAPGGGRQPSTAVRYGSLASTLAQLTWRSGVPATWRPGAGVAPLRGDAAGDAEAVAAAAPTGAGVGVTEAAGAGEAAAAAVAV